MTRCDKWKRRSPCAEPRPGDDGPALLTMTCWCGRKYIRCANHGGKSGAKRSLAQHHRVGNHLRDKP